MDFRDAWIFSPGKAALNIDLPEKKRFTLREIKEAYDPVIAEMKECKDMFRLQKVGLEWTADELIRQGKITRDEWKQLASKNVRKAAAQENFDLDAAQKRFFKK